MSEIQRYEAEVPTYAQRASEITVASKQDMENGVALVKSIKTYKKQVDEFFDPRIEQAHALHKGLLADKRKFSDPLDKAEKIVKGKIGGYMAECEEKARVEEEKAREEARKEHEKAVEKASKKVAALIEKTGNLQEQIDIILNELQNPETTVEESIALNAQLEVLTVKRGNLEAKITEKQQEVFEERFTAPLAPGGGVPKVQGMSDRSKLIPEIVNPMDVIRAVANGTIPMNIIKFDLGAIGKLINGGLKIPGVVGKKEREVRVRV